GVAARVADPLLPRVVAAGDLGQAVVPGRIEAVVGGQVHHQGARRRGVDAGDDLAGLAVRQRQHHHVGATGRDLVVGDVLEPQVAPVGVVVVGHALAGELARGHEGQFQPGVGGDQADQLGAGVAARADDADGVRLVAHAWASSLAWRWLRTPGHSLSRMENTTVSRRVPSACRLWWRSTPSCFAPSWAMAAREAWLNQEVSKPTQAQPIASKAWCSSISLHSVFTPVRCTRGAYQV